MRLHRRCEACTCKCRAERVGYLSKGAINCIYMNFSSVNLFFFIRYVYKRKRLTDHGVDVNATTKSFLTYKPDMNLYDDDNGTIYQKTIWSICDTFIIILLLNWDIGIQDVPKAHGSQVIKFSFKNVSSY